MTVSHPATRLAGLVLSLSGVVAHAAANDNAPPPVPAQGNDSPIALLNRDLPRPPAALQAAVNRVKAAQQKVDSVKKIIEKERSLGDWHTTATDGNTTTEDRFDVARSHLDVIDHFGTGGGLRTPYVRMENGARLDSELIGGRHQATVKSDDGTVTLGLRAGIDGHAEAIEHTNQPLTGARDPGLQADNGLHYLTTVVASMQAYNSFTWRFSPANSITASSSVGLSDTLYGRASGALLSTSAGNLSQLTVRGYGPTATADVTWRHDVLHPFRWMGADVAVVGKFKNALYYDVRDHQLENGFKVGAAVEKKLSLAAFHKQHQLTLSVGLYEEKQPGSSLALRPEVRVETGL
ncbi:MAG TPA: hypothetical protein VGO93_18680 [Candidatus Xenobia bacterium]|jgi:hypothetical protein